MKLKAIGFGELISVTYVREFCLNFIRGDLSINWI